MRASAPEGALIFQFAFDAEGRIGGIYFFEEAQILDAAALRARTAAWSERWSLALRSWGPGDEPARTWTAVGGGARPADPMPLGSIFKIYVLAGLAREIGSGTLHWEDPVELRRELRSLPSGITQDEEPGSRLTVEELVTRMIRISDNTAADHLLHLMGRRKIEALLPECFVSAPEWDRPFLSTRQMFLLKGLAEIPEEFDTDLDGLAELWRDGDSGDRHEILLALGQATADEDPDAALQRAGVGYLPRTQDFPKHLGIEWYARPAEVARFYEAVARGSWGNDAARAAFRRGLERSSTLLWMPGIVEQGFKGGSETGLFALSLYARREDGREVALCLVRQGVPALDPRVDQASVRYFTAVARAALEGRIPAPAAGG